MAAASPSRKEHHERQKRERLERHNKCLRLQPSSDTDQVHSVPYAEPTTPMSPDPTTHDASDIASVDLKLEQLALSDLSDPEIRSAITGQLKANLSTISPPRTEDDLFVYAFDVRRELSSHEVGQLLLLPPNTYPDPKLRLVSMNSVSFISSKIPRDIFHPIPQPNSVYHLLTHLEQSAQEPVPLSGSPPNYRFPMRSKSETLATYVRRVELWLARFHPNADHYPVSFVHSFANEIWFNHASLYDLRSLRPIFLQQRDDEFETISDALSWFQAQDLLKPALNSTSSQSKSHFSRKRSSQGSNNTRNHDQSKHNYQGNKDKSYNKNVNKTTRRLNLHVDKIQDLMSFANIEVSHCDGKTNRADVLTKPLSGPSFRDAAQYLLQTSHSSTQQGSVRENVNT